MKKEHGVSGRAKGGKARAKALSPEARTEIARKAAERRWDRPTLVAVHGSDDHPLRIGGIAIPCYVLADGTRVLSQRGLQGGIGISEGGKKGGERKVAALMSRIESKGINIRNLIARANSPIRFIPPHGGNPADGYDATILPDICAVLIEADQKGALDSRQKKLAERAAILQHGFATVGIIALVDEATGFQKDRARDALAKILEAFVAKELRPWVKTFPSEFYEEMFRLRNLKFSGDSVKRPQYFGHLTNDVIYRRLAPGVLQELKKNAELDKVEGKVNGKLHQRLTSNIGHPKLKDLLISVTTIMKLSTKWDDFKEKLNRVHPAYNETLTLPFEGEALPYDDGQGI